MDGLVAIKVLHILSATILFGTGLGTAFFFWSARNQGDVARLYAARTTVKADFLFTLPAVILQPVTGLWLAQRSGQDLGAFWLLASYALYAVAGACWIPVVFLQIRMARLLEKKLFGEPVEEASIKRLQRQWFVLGWPAFGALIAVFVLMVAKPNW